MMLSEWRLAPASLLLLAASMLTSSLLPPPSTHAYRSVAQDASPIRWADRSQAEAELPALQPGSWSPDSRFGVILTDAVSSVDANLAAAMLEALGAANWYSFDERPGLSSGRAQLVRPGVDLAQLTERASGAPGTTWLIGVEPNVPGQDDLDPAVYAEFLAQVASAIRGVDASAVLVGPNTLNWDDTCTVCPGFPSGRAWSESFLESYRASYGDLPLDAWGMHTYSLDWRQLPLAHAAADQVQLRGAREWLDTQAMDLPLWLTEFGVVWGYDGIEWVRQVDATFLAEPRGSYRIDLLAAYLDQMFAWLLADGVSPRVERWYLYASIPQREPYASAPTGIALFDAHSLSLTDFGRQFRNWAIRPVTAEPQTLPSETPSAPASEESRE